MSSEPVYKFGDPVWSKMRGFCAWPSRIGDPSESQLKNNLTEKQRGTKPSYLVYFFGSNNWAWMPEDTIKPYGVDTEKFEKGAKTVQFKQGIQQIKDYIARGGKDSLTLPNSGGAIQNNNNDNAASMDASPSVGGDSFSNDNSNLDASSGELPTIDEELAVIKNVKPASASTTKRSKNSHDSHSISSPVPSSVHKDNSRSPYSKSARKLSKSNADDSDKEITSPTKRQKTSNFDEDHNLGSATLSSSTLSPTVPKPTPKIGARNVIMRSQYNDSPSTDVPKVNFNSISAKSKSIRPSNLKFGFIGLGLMGQRILKNILNSGHQVTIWNRSHDKCKAFVEAGAEAKPTPSDVVAASDIIFGCLKDFVATKETMFGTFGILGEMNETKGYVEMSSIDSDTSQDLFDAIIAKGGLYLEAPALMSGKKAAEDGELVIVATGDRKLYDDCTSCFQAISKKTFYLGPQIGAASQMNAVVGSLFGTMIGGLSECLTLLDRNDMPASTFRDIMRLLPLNCPILETCMDKIITGKTAVPEIPIDHVSRHLRLALQLSDKLDQMTPIMAAVNELFKDGRRVGLADQDASAMYLRNRF